MGIVLKKCVCLEKCVSTGALSLSKLFHHYPSNNDLQMNVHRTIQQRNILGKYFFLYYDNIKKIICDKERLTSEKGTSYGVTCELRIYTIKLIGKIALQQIFINCPASGRDASVHLIRSPGFFQRNWRT
jgi:hypothetical protein